MSDGDFLSRWSRRKIEARKGAEAIIPAEAGIQPPAQALATPSPAAEPPAPLPPVESLTPESDFLPFMKAAVDPDLKRAALKTLFQDPRFNVMDGLDVYIDDYSKPDPLPDGWLEKLNQLAEMGDHGRAAAEALEKSAGKPGNITQAEDKQEVAAESGPHPNGASGAVSPPSESKDC